MSKIMKLSPTKMRVSYFPNMTFPYRKMGKGMPYSGEVSIEGREERERNRGRAEQHVTVTSAFGKLR